jgi:hypothetical protein
MVRQGSIYGSPSLKSFMRSPEKLKDVREGTEVERQSKRQKLDSATEEFLRTYTSPVMFSVQVPDVTDTQAGWSLNGQILCLSLDPKDTIKAMKDLIKGHLGIPLNKQKLLFSGVFLKDHQTIAACHIEPGSLVTLEVKKRGGTRHK